ncbi:MAG: hypothetical protein J1F17_06845 [Oscillospiraceae bacterium]|nr:hypothetical protein [Oscillospiraceae bacterium]
MRNLHKHSLGTAVPLTSSEVKVKKKIRKIRNTIIAYVVLSAVSIIIFAVAHNYANIIRPANGYGGELMAFLIPFMVWAFNSNVKLTRKGVSEND